MHKVKLTNETKSQTQQNTSQTLHDFQRTLLWSVSLKQFLAWYILKNQTGGKIGLGEFDAVEELSW